MVQKPKPKWLVDLAGDVHVLLHRYKALALWRNEVQAWSVDNADTRFPTGRIPCRPSPLGMKFNLRRKWIELVPLPDRELSTAENFALFAAIHDVCLPGERIDPWASLPNTPENYETRRSSIPYLMLYADVARFGFPEEHEKLLRVMLADLENAIAAKKREKPRRKKISAQEANKLLEELYRHNPKAKKWVQRRLMDAIPCSAGVLNELPAYSEVHPKRETAPKTVSLTDDVIARHPDAQAELNRLAAEQEADKRAYRLFARGRGRRARP
jgi:hypothetical protein